jgi:hypothetical protein
MQTPYGIDFSYSVAYMYYKALFDEILTVIEVTCRSTNSPVKMCRHFFSEGAGGWKGAITVEC